MGEILFLCGDNKRIVVATLSVISYNVEGYEDSLKEEVTLICAVTVPVVQHLAGHWVELNVQPCHCFLFAVEIFLYFFFF